MIPKRNKLRKKRIRLKIRTEHPYETSIIITQIDCLNIERVEIFAWCGAAVGEVLVQDDNGCFLHNLRARATERLANS